MPSMTKAELQIVSDLPKKPIQNQRSRRPCLSNRETKHFKIMKPLWPKRYIKTLSSSKSGELIIAVIASDS